MNNMICRAKAKGVIGKDWIEGYFCYGPYSDRPCIQDIITHELISIDADTLCYDTGETDKNGEKIWTNDIVKGLFHFGLAVDSKVVFKEGAFGLEWHRSDNTNIKLFNAFCQFCNVEYEVIGNVFDGVDYLINKTNESVEPDLEV